MTQSPNKLLTLLSALLLAVGALLAPALPAAEAFTEGVDFRRLSTPVSAISGSSEKVEVVELFWYGCPHCNRLEPAVEEWVEHKPDNVEFVRLPAVLNRSWELGARAFYIAESLGILDEIHKPLFDAIHVQKRPMRGPDDLAAFFADHGVDRATFDKTYNSFDVDTKLRRGNKKVQGYGVHGVPAIIVNGKYETSVSMAGSHERLFEVVDYLVEKEAEG